MAERQKLVKPFSIRGPLPEGLAIAQEMKFSINVLKSTCDQIRSFLQIWSHLNKKFFMENFIFCAVEVGFELAQNIVICYEC